VSSISRRHCILAGAGLYFHWYQFRLTGILFSSSFSSRVLSFITAYQSYMVTCEREMSNLTRYAVYFVYRVQASSIYAVHYIENNKPHTCTTRHMGPYRNLPGHRCAKTWTVLDLFLSVGLSRFAEAVDAPFATFLLQRWSSIR